MGKITDEILIKNALITKHYNIFKDGVEGMNPTEYWLHLTEKQFTMFREMGLNAKEVHQRSTGDVLYIVTVKPVRILETKYNPEIPAPAENEFLEKDNVDIKFFVYSVDYHDRTIKVLYFNRKSMQK
jgi:hypothetical protein